MKTSVAIVAATLALMCMAASAAVPPMISYQGKLMQPSGAAVPDGTHSMQFAIYDVPTGGTALWSETNPSVHVNGGLFATMLGSVANLPADIFDNPSRFFGVKVGDDPEMMPRQQVASSAYAFRAAVAGSVDDGAITTAKLADGAVTTSKITGSAITSEKFAPEAVTTVALANGAVTADKLASGAVSGEAIASTWQNWAPVFSGTGGSPGAFSFGLSHARYLTIGKMVFVMLAGRVTSVGSWTGVVQVSLPLAPTVPNGDRVLSGFIAQDAANPATGARGIPVIPDGRSYLSFLASAGRATLTWSAVRDGDYISVQGFYEIQ